ncbi:MAG: hypothetical protein ACYDB3_12680 [Acidimicrobiales bacterium]
MDAGADLDVVGRGLDALTDGEMLQDATAGDTGAPSPLSGDPDASCPLGAWQMVAVLGDASTAALSGSAANDVWGVGGSVMLHFDGGSWSVVPNPLPAGGAYSSIWAAAPNDAWAVAGGPLFHFDGGGWSSTPGPDAGASLVSGHTPEVWLAQSSVVGLTQPQVFENAVGWTQLGDLQTERFPAPTGLWGTSPNDVWMAGTYFRSMGIYPVVASHWDGTQWNQYSPPGDLWGSSYSGAATVWGSASNDVWFATQHGVWHWDGANLAIVPFALSAFPNYSEEFFAVWGTAANDVWLAGTDIFHWDGSTWSCTAPPGVAPVVSLWNSSPHDVWAATSTGVVLHGP